MTTSIFPNADWTKRSSLWGVTVGAAIRSGWLALHWAALHGGRTALRKVRRTGAAGIAVRWSDYHHRTWRIALRIGAPATTQSSVVSVRGYGEYVARQLVSAVPDVTRHRQLTQQTYDTIQRELVSTRVRIPTFTDETPYSLLSSSYRVFTRKETDSGIARNELAALMVLGLAVRGITLMGRCELCFRWAIPGYRFCQQHSQSAHAPGSPSARSARYRRGKGVASYYDHLPREPAVFARRPARRLPQLIAQQLWGAPMRDEERTGDAIRRALLRNPSVLDMVGADAVKLKTARLLNRLAERLDPYEVSPTAWVWIIGRAAHWNQIEARVYGAPRAMQRVTRIYIRVATAKAKEGLTRAEIAEVLGIQRSAISNWLRRGVAPELAAALAAHPDGRTAPRRRPGIARRSR